MAATRKLDQSQLMIQADAQGNQAVQQAHDSKQRNTQITAERDEGARQFDEQVEQQELDRWQRQWEDKRANEFREKQLAEGARQFDDQQALTAADRGLVPTGGGESQQRIGQQPAMGTTGGNNPRMQAMMAEMNRGAEQGRQGLEIDTQGRGYVKSQGRLEGEAAAQQTAMSDAQTRLINEQASYQRTVNSYQMAEMRMLAADTAAAKAEQEAALKELSTELMQPVKSTVGMLDRMNTPGKSSEGDWQTIVSELTPPKGQPLPEQLKTLLTEAQGGVWTPGLQRFYQQKATAQAVKFIYGTGKLPEGDMVDFSSPGMREFVAHARDISIMNAPHMPGPGQMLSFKDQAERNRFINRRAAWSTLTNAPTTFEEAWWAEKLLGIPPGEEGYPPMAGGEDYLPTHREKRGDEAPGQGAPITVRGAKQVEDRGVRDSDVKNYDLPEDTERKRTLRNEFNKLSNPGAVRPGHFMGR
jgi:hypothetical protein